MLLAVRISNYGCTLSMNKFLIYSYLKGGAFTEVEKDEVF